MIKDYYLQVQRKFQQFVAQIYDICHKYLYVFLYVKFLRNRNIELN